MDKPGLRLTDPEGLLQEWSSSYSLPDPLNCYTLDTLPVFEAKSYQAFSKSGVNCILSGFSGGVRYAPVVRYTRAHVWVDETEIASFMKLTGCKPVESGANIIIFPASGKEVFADSRITNDSRVASPVQVYLDCMQLKGRGEEMAMIIYEKEIRRI